MASPNLVDRKMIVEQDLSALPVNLARDDPRPSLDRPSFWIRRAPDPNRALLTPRRLAEADARIRRREPQRVDPLGLPDRLPGETIRAWIEAEPLPPDGPRYHANGRRVTRPDCSRLRSRMGLSALKGARPVRFGLITGEADVRGAPTTA